MDLIFISSLANTNNLLAKFISLLYKDTSKDRHGQGDDGGDKVSTVVSVAILTTETISLQVFNTHGNGRKNGSGSHHATSICSDILVVMITMVTVLTSVLGMKVTHGPHNTVNQAVPGSQARVA